MSARGEPGTYLEPDDPQLAALDDLDLDDGYTVVWVKDGKLVIEEDAGGSPRSWPIEEGA